MTQTPGDDFARLHAVVKGRVQGVYFRATTQHEAVARGLSGWVRNRWDGSVEVVAEGEEPELVRFLTAIRESGMKYHIENVETKWTEPVGTFRKFGINY